MSSHLLTLVFPQWQGSGNRKYVYYGAKLISGMLPDGLPYEEVAVGLDEDIRLENGMWGYRQIVGYLAGARDIIGQAKPEKIFLIGGDCGAAMAPISYLNRLYGGDLAVVWLDAHSDLNTPSTSTSHNFPGMSLRCLLGDGDRALVRMCFSLLLPKQVILGGTRDLDPPEAEFIRNSGIGILTVDDISADMESVSRLIATKGYHNLYIHLDLDVLDTGKCPWAPGLTPDGMDTDTLIALIRSLKAKFNLVGISVGELRPVEGMDLRPLKDLVWTCKDI